MSWRLQLSFEHGHIQLLTEEMLKTVEGQNPGCEAAVREAWRAARDIVYSGVLGDAGEHGFSISLVGHHNPDNVSGGGTPDLMTIGIGQR